MSAAAPAGLLELRFARDSDGRTRLVERAQRFPLHLTVPMYLDSAEPAMAFVYVQNPTGGVFAGDDLVLRVFAEPGARVHLTTPAATKVYRMEGGEARERIELRLGEGAYLEYVPEPVIPQAGSRFSQALVAEVGMGARLLVVEALAPGRLAREEAFAYDRLELRTCILDGHRRELCTDALLLEPARRAPARRGLLGPYPFLGTVLAVAPGNGPEELSTRLDESVRDVPGAVAAAGALPWHAGAFARVLASTSGRLREALDAAWRAAREAMLGTAPPARRK